MGRGQNDKWLHCPVQRTPFIFDGTDELMVKGYFLLYPNLSLYSLLLPFSLMIMSSSSLKQHVVGCYLYARNIPQVHLESGTVLAVVSWVSERTGGSLHTSATGSISWQLKKKAHHQPVLNKVVGISFCRLIRDTCVHCHGFLGGLFSPKSHYCKFRITSDTIMLSTRSKFSMRRNCRESPEQVFLPHYVLFYQYYSMCLCKNTHTFHPLISAGCHMPEKP